MIRPKNSHFGAALLAWAICSILYVFTAEGAAQFDGDRRDAWHNYDYLVEGFLAGQLNLSVDPAPELLALPDPYDPSRNAAFRLIDGSLYHGKYYLYFGPTPALLLLLPWKVLTGHFLPVWAATATAAVAGLGALAFLLTYLRRHCFPACSASGLFLAVVLAGHLNWMPVLLRRPSVWELPIVTALALFWASLVCLARYHAENRSQPWAFAGGLMLALALGSRPTYLPAAAVVALLFIWPQSRRTSLRELGRRALPVLTPLVAGGCLLLLYNFLRFDQWFEFGQRYQLGGSDDRNKALFSLPHVWTNLRLYFFSTPTLSPYFPFLRTVWPTDLPSDYLGVEELPGWPVTLPSLTMGLIGFRLVAKTATPQEKVGLRTVVVASAVGATLVACLLLSFGGSCSRYLGEMYAGITVLGALGIIASAAKLADRSHRTARWHYGLMTAGTIGVVSATWLSSFEFRNYAKVTQPITYRLLATAGNFPSAWVAEASRQTFGPVSLEVKFSDQLPTGRAVLLSTGRQEMLNRFIVEKISATHARFLLTVNNVIIVSTPVMEVPRLLPNVICSAPWLYPPAESPYWAKDKNLADRQMKQSRWSIQVNGQTYAAQTRGNFDAVAFDPYVREEGPPAACAWVARWRRMESIEIETPPSSAAP